MIKHVSFDLWGTLFKSNPLFKQERISFIHSNFNPKDYSIEKVREAVQQIDVACNEINEITGGNIRSIEMYALVLMQLGCPIKAVQGLKSYSDMLFVYHSPFLFPHVKETLRKLKEQGITLSVLSNTGFIEGYDVRAALQMNGILEYFDFCLFSDEIKVSKPNHMAFNEVYAKARDLRNDIKRNEILHVGDSIVADVEGAKKALLSSLQINTNSLTIKDVLNENFILRTPQHSQSI